MKEKLEILGRKLLKNIRIVAIVFFAVHLAVAFFLSSSETNFQEPVAPPPPQKPLNNKFPSENHDLLLSNYVNQTKDISEDPKVSRLIRVNMFDDKSVASEMELEAAVRDDFVRAQQAYSEGRADEAERLVDAILQRNPTHRGSNELKKRIEADRAAALPPAEGAAEGTP